MVTHEEYLEIERRRAKRYATDLVQMYWKGQGAKDRLEVKTLLEKLVEGTHPRFPGITIERNDFDIINVPTCDGAYMPHDGAYNVLRNVPTHDKSIFFRRATKDEEPDEQWDDDGEAVEMIMSELKDLATRLDKLDKIYEHVPTRGPAMTPRELNPQQAYQAHMTAYQMTQARASQRKAHAAFPDKFPQHPDDAHDDAREQQEATRDFNASACGRSIHAHKMIAHTGHLTFTDRETINSNMKQRFRLAG